MNHCKTCKWWGDPKEEAAYKEHFVDQGYAMPAEYGGNHKPCQHPHIAVGQHGPGMVYLDDPYYKICPEGSFGCVHHKEVE